MIFLKQRISNFLKANHIQIDPDVKTAISSKGKKYKLRDRIKTIGEGG